MYKCHTCTKGLYKKNSVRQLQPYLLIKMFHSQIGPIMHYTSEVWFQNKVTPQLMKIHLKFQLIKYRKRITGMNNKFIVKKTYNSTCQLHELSQNNWCTSVKEMLYEASSLSSGLGRPAYG